jgi:hypothetical protein
MAGADPTGQFDAAAFRSNIRATMSLALPNTVSYQPTFRWLIKPEFNVADPAGRPYNWFGAEAGDTPAAIPDIQVPCAVTYSGGSESGTEEGFIEELKVKLTVLDEDMNTILANGNNTLPDQVLLKDQVYEIAYIPNPVALFTVDVYEIYAVAQDAS